MCDTLSSISPVCTLSWNVSSWQEGGNYKSSQSYKCQVNVSLGVPIDAENSSRMQPEVTVAVDDLLPMKASRSFALFLIEPRSEHDNIS